MTKTTSDSDTLQDLLHTISEWIADEPMIPECLQIPMHEVSDGYVALSSDLTDVFAKASQKYVPSRYLKFQKMPISHSIATFPEPLVLISDETELDAETYNIVRKRNENGYATFPVIVFTDSFFRLAYGECCSYAKITEIFEDAVKDKVMTFRKSEFDALPNYLLAVSSIIKIHKMMTALEELFAYLEQEITREENAVSEENPVAGLISISRVRALDQLWIEAERYEKQLQEQTAVWKAEINKLREISDKRVHELLLHVNAEKLSEFAINIDLKYGTLQKYIYTYLTSRSMKADYGMYTDDLKRLCDESLNSISYNSAKLSLIGTFSSGKTTLINTFLGNRDIPLRTSMAHNTAVLMQLYYVPSEQEYYEIIYKKNLVWSVIKPASQQKLPVNTEKDTIRILDIQKNPAGYRIRYSTRDKQTVCKTIRATNDLAVKRGDTLKPGEPFVKNVQQASRYVELCSAGELHLLINLLSQSNEGRAKTLNGALKNHNREMVGQEIAGLLNRLLSIAGNTSKTIQYEVVCQAMKLHADINPLTGKEEYPEHYRRLEVSCPLNRVDERKTLDRKGWIELCGDPNASKEQKTPAFSEMPECYLLAKELHLHIHSEFLQYCSLTDTPGFGSVTEEHDAITERYIRDSSGRLLVMIAVNPKTMDAKYQDLINSINDIYNNFRNSDKKNVVFILNCFTNLSSADRLKSHVDQVVSMLTGYGFNKSNIFVCNLRDALESKKETETMLGYPSYKKFHDFIIHEMISSDLSRKYKGIEQNWQNLFRDLKNRVQNEIYNAERALKDATRYRTQLENELNATQNVEITDWQYSGSLLESFQEWYNQAENAYINNRKGIFTTIRWNAIVAALDSIADQMKLKNEEMVEWIQDYYSKCLRDVAYKSNTEKSMPELPEADYACVVMEMEKLRSLLNEADDETGLFNKSEKHQYYTDKMVEIFQSGKEQSEANLNEYCTRCFEVADAYQHEAIWEKQQLLWNAKDADTLRKSLERANRISDNIRNLEKEFQKIKFNV